jgi:hypothetical protein
MALVSTVNFTLDEGKAPLLFFGDRNIVGRLLS